MNNRIRVSPNYRPKPAMRQSVQSPKKSDFTFLDLVKGRTNDSQVGMYSDLEKLKNELKAKIQEVDSTLQRVQQTQKGEKGDKGDPYRIHKPVLGQDFFNGKDGVQGLQGEPGYTPIRGKDYFTKSDVMMIVEQVQKMIRMPRDGRDPDYELIVQKVTENFHGKLKTKHIEGLDQTIESITYQVRKGYLHGGGDTIRAGTGVTLTRNSDGTVTITATGVGGTALAIFTATPFGAVNGVNTTYLFANSVTEILGFWINGQYIDSSQYTTLGTAVAFGTALPVELSGAPFEMVYVNGDLTDLIKETPVGAINGVNTVYNLSQTPTSILGLWANGQYIDSSQYTQVGGALHFISPLPIELASTSFEIAYITPAIALIGTIYTQTPSGLINGSNTVYTTLNSITQVYGLYINGEYIHTSEYSKSGNQLTMLSALPIELAGTPFEIIYA